MSIPLQSTMDLGPGSFVSHTHKGTPKYPYPHKIALANNENTWQERHLNINDAIALANDYARLELLDSYVGINGLGWSGGRTVSNVTELSSFYVDFDYYKLERFKDFDVADFAQLLVNENPWLPIPTVVVDSGMGCWFVWSFKRPVQINIKTAKIPFLATWQTTQGYLVDRLKDYGADPACKDAARVMRLPNTINSKNHRVAEAWLSGEDYDFNSLRQVISDEYQRTHPKKQLTPSTSKKQLTPITNKKYSGKGAKVSRLFTWHLLADYRMKDIVALAKLRGGKLTDNRRMAAYAFAVAAAHYCQTESALKSQVEQFIWDCLADPDKYQKSINYKEVVRRFNNHNAVRRASGFKAAEKLDRKDNLYSHTTKYLINVLEITPKEQRKMLTIISHDEKMRRLTDRRRKAGIKSRDEYLAVSKERRVEALKLHGEGLSQREIAKRMNLSRGAIQLYLSQVD
jgi:predicted DNA-binding protein (UPF0251 family)